MKRKNRSVCICGYPMKYALPYWVYMYKRTCPHGKRRIGFLVRRRYVTETFEGRQYGSWLTGWGSDILDMEWRKKRARKHAKRAGVRKKYRKERQKYGR